MPHTLLHSGIHMERFNILSTIMLFFNALIMNILPSVESLQKISLLVAIIWGVVQIIIHSKELKTAIKSWFKKGF